MFFQVRVPANPSMGIVDAVRDQVQRLYGLLCRPGQLAVYYAEVYGRNIGAARQYTREGKVGFRLFDVAILENYEELFGWTAERIAHWRDQGGQCYLAADRLVQAAAEVGFEPVPALFDLDASQLPTGLEDTDAFVRGLGASRCKLDETAEG